MAFHRSLRLGYDRIAMTLHWAIGVALLAQLVFGFALDEIAPRSTPARAELINLHKSLGLVLAALVLLRLGWRFTRQPPAWPPGVSVSARRAAFWGHRALYACMLLMPASAYIASNYGKQGLKFFGLAMVPWGTNQPAAYAFFSGLHLVLAWFFSALVAGHVALALNHLLLRRDGLFQRMWPWALAARLPSGRGQPLNCPAPAGPVRLVG